MTIKDLFFFFKALLISLFSALTLPILLDLHYQYPESVVGLLYVIQGFCNVTCVIGYYYLYKKQQLSFINTVPVIILNFIIFYICESTFLTPGIASATYSTYLLLIIQFLKKDNIQNVVITVITACLIQTINLVAISFLTQITYYMQYGNIVEFIAFIMIVPMDYFIIIKSISLFKK